MALSQLGNFKDTERIEKLVSRIVVSIDSGSGDGNADDTWWDTVMFFLEIPGVIDCICAVINKKWKYDHEDHHVAMPTIEDFVTGWLCDLNSAMSNEETE